MQMTLPAVGVVIIFISTLKQIRSRRPHTGVFSEISSAHNQAPSCQGD
jgi:hypothetical protein